jgi:hypothetical protein
VIRRLDTVVVNRLEIPAGALQLHNCAVSLCYRVPLRTEQVAPMLLAILASTGASAKRFDEVLRLYDSSTATRAAKKALARNPADLKPSVIENDPISVGCTAVRRYGHRPSFTRCSYAGALGEHVITIELDPYLSGCPGKLCHVTNQSDLVIALPGFTVP